MNAQSSQSSLARVNELLAVARNKGVKFWCEGGQLRYRAPAGALTSVDIDLLRSEKDRIVSIVSEGTWHNRAPLSFSQLAHWNLYHLNERPSFREVASVSRLTGQLNTDAFRKSVAENIRRHDALRTRIAVIDGVPEQEILPALEFEPELVDLTAIAESDRFAEIDRQIEDVILKPIDISAVPLFAIRVLHLSAGEHVLILATEHMISDAFSVGILLRDLLAGYEQLIRGDELSLPIVPLQFHQYAVRQQNAHESMLPKRGAFLNECLKRYRRVRFTTGVLGGEPRTGWGEAPIEIGADMKAELTEWCRRHHTTLPMAVFAAYVALSLRWCGTSEMVVQYIVDGRGDPATRDAMGYFASVIYLHIVIGEQDSFLDLVVQATNEFCRAHANADASYIESRAPRPEFTRGTAFNWIPRGAQENSVSYSPIQFKHPRLKNLERDNEPVIVLFEAVDQIMGGVYFPAAQFSAEFMERYAKNFRRFMQVLLSAPEKCVNEICLV